MTVTVSQHWNTNPPLIGTAKPRSHHIDAGYATIKPATIMVDTRTTKLTTHERGGRAGNDKCPRHQVSKASERVIRDELQPYWLAFKYTRYTHESDRCATSADVKPHTEYMYYYISYTTDPQAGLAPTPPSTTESLVR